MPAVTETPILDASALLAYLGDETGADVVADAIAGGATISAVNLGEALSTLAARGTDPRLAASELQARGVLDGAITVQPFITEDAVEVARLRPLTRSAGLSIADRACLALGRRLSAPVLTADQSWSALDIDVEIRTIREPRQRRGRRRP